MEMYNTGITSKTLTPVYAPVPVSELKIICKRKLEELFLN